MGRRKRDLCPVPRVHNLSEARSIAAFHAWLDANGAEVLAPTNRYEVFRFRGAGVLSVIYRNERGRPHTMTGQAEAAWTAFLHGEALDLAPPPPAYIEDAARRVPAMSDAALIARAARQPITIAWLMQHDEMPMREAAVRLFGLERDGRLVRSGGDRRDPLRWSAAAEVLEIHHAG